MPDNTDQTDNQPIPESMGIDEALDIMNQGTKDYDGVATEEEEQDVSDDETEDTSEEEEESKDSDEEDTDEISDEDDEEEDEDDEEESEHSDFVFMDGEGEDAVGIDAVEAKKGYMRTKDYTQKTQKLASALKTTETTNVSLLETQAKYVESLAGVKAAMSTELKDFVSIDWVELQKNDPLEYEEKEREFQAASLAYQQTVAIEEEEKEKLTVAAMEYVQKLKKEEMEKLVTFIPQVAEDGNTLLQDITVFAAERYGFSEKELLNTYDNRMIRVLADAFNGHAQADKLDKGKKKVKGMKTTKSKASRSHGTSKARAAKKRKASLRREGGISIDEALKLMGP